MDRAVELCLDIAVEYNGMGWWMVERRLAKQGIHGINFQVLAARLYDHADFILDPYWECQNTADWGEECGHQNKDLSALPIIFHGQLTGWHVPEAEGRTAEDFDCWRCEDRPAWDADGTDLSWSFFLRVTDEAKSAHLAKRTPPPPRPPSKLDLLRKAVQTAVQRLTDAVHERGGELHNRGAACDDRWPCDVERARRVLARALAAFENTDR